MNIRLLLAAAGLASFALLAGCSTTQVGLKYEAPASASKARNDASVSIGTFVDSRGNGANWLGAIRGGFGNPLKTLESDVPVAKLVEATFDSGLKARGFREGREFQVGGVIRKLESSQMARREAHAVIDVTVTKLANGQQVFTRTYTADNVEGSIFNLQTGVFASTEDLRAVLERTLREVVDKALDDSALRNALGSY